MGNFEKLSVLVIVVIIVMILAVAVVEWTNGGSEVAGGGEATTEQAAAGGARTPPESGPSTPLKAGTAGEKRDEKSGSFAKGWGSLFEDPDKEKDGSKTEKTPKDVKPPESGAKKPETAPEGEPKTQDIAETTHVVATGETLSEISKKLYGKASLWTVIRDANPGVTPDNLRPKQVLKIPAMKGVLAGTNSSPTPAGGTPSGGAGGVRPVAGKEYTVRPNDTWEKVSMATYGTASRWPEIYIKNISRVRDQKDLTPGKVIMLPK